MARNETTIEATPAQVFGVLMNPDSYGHWVVGSRSIRGADPNWPAVGSRFHHSVGFGPFTRDDHTRIEALEPNRRLVLKAKARPFATALIELELEPHAGGTRLVMVERAGDALSRLALNPLTDPLIHLRNNESLRRLKDLAEGSGRS